jgi:hypothetical protein
MYHPIAPLSYPTPTPQSPIPPPSPSLPPPNLRTIRNILPVATFVEKATRNARRTGRSKASRNRENNIAQNPQSKQNAAPSIQLLDGLGIIPQAHLNSPQPLPTQHLYLTTPLSPQKGPSHPTKHTFLAPHHLI